MSEQNTLRDQLEAGFDQIEETQESNDRLRDEAGRFAKAEEAEPVEAKGEPVEAQTETEEPVIEVKRPSSWKKEMWEKYDTLEPEVRDYILQRESESANSLHQFRTQAEEAKSIKDVIAPYIPEFQKDGINPAGLIDGLVKAHYGLVRGSPEQKAQFFSALAKEYNVPLGYLTEGVAQPQIDPQVQWTSQQVQNLRQEFNQVQQTLQQQQETALNAQIQEFKASHPHFDAVKADMGELLRSGLAPDMQTAYDKAIRLNDEVWKAAHVAQPNIQQKVEAAVKAKTAAVSPKSSSPSGRKTAPTTDRRAQIEEALDALSARV